MFLPKISATLFINYIATPQKLIHLLVKSFCIYYVTHHYNLATL